MKKTGLLALSVLSFLLIKTLWFYSSISPANIKARAEAGDAQAQFNLAVM